MAEGRAGDVRGPCCGVECVARVEPSRRGRSASTVVLRWTTIILGSVRAVDAPWRPRVQDGCRNRAGAVVMTASWWGEGNICSRVACKDGPAL